MAFVNWSFMYPALTAATAYITLRWIHNKIMEKPQINKNNDDCILFWPKALTYKCVGLSSCKNFCCPKCSFNEFVALLKSANRTLDVCVYLITSEEVTNVIINLFRKGIFVRIITDKQISEEAHNSTVYLLIKEHIPIKMVQSAEMMHNKFVIIDQKKLITGSFNWTKQAATYNYENAIITHNERIIKKYSDYFHNIWCSL